MGDSLVAVVTHLVLSTVRLPSLLRNYLSFQPLTSPPPRISETPTCAICIWTSIGLSLLHSTLSQGSATQANAPLHTPQADSYTCTERHGHSACSPRQANMPCKSAAQCTTLPFDTHPMTIPAHHVPAYYGSLDSSFSPLKTRS
jgi:hypothetical protein